MECAMAHRLLDKRWLERGHDVVAAYVVGILSAGSHAFSLACSASCAL